MKRNESLVYKMYETDLELPDIEPDATKIQSNATKPKA